MSLGTKNVSDIERGVAGITISTLKRICEKLSVSSDSILFASLEKNNVHELAERLERLPSAQFVAIEKFLNQTIEMFGLLRSDDQHEQ